MIKVYTFNIFYEICDFFKRNMVKLIITLIIFLLGLGLGVKNALAITDVGGYLASRNSNTFVLIIGEKSIISYFFMRLLLVVMMCAIIYILSFNYILCFLNFVLLFFYAYLSMLYITLFIVLFKVVIFPFMFLCMLPFMLFIYFALACLVIMALNRGREIKLYGCYKNINFLGFLKSVSPLLIILLILLILEAVLSFTLTLGVVI